MTGSRGVHDSKWEDWLFTVHRSAIGIQLECTMELKVYRYQIERRWTDNHVSAPCCCFGRLWKTEQCFLLVAVEKVVDVFPSSRETVWNKCQKHFQCGVTIAQLVEINRYLGFTNISVSAKTADFIGLSRCWQNAVIFLTHPDNLRKKAQRSKSRQLSYNNASRCGFINKQTRLTMEYASAVAAETSTTGKIRNAWSYHVQVLCTNKLPLYFRKFSQHETIDCNLKVQKSNRYLV